MLIFPLAEHLTKRCNAYGDLMKLNPWQLTLYVFEHINNLAI